MISHRLTKIVAVTATAAAALLGLSACSGSAGGATDALTLGFIPGQSTDPFFLSMQKGAAAEAKKLGVKLIWQGAPTWGSSVQTPIVQSINTKGVDFMVLDPTDATAMVPPIRQVVNGGTPVGVVDDTIDDTSLLKFQILADNQQGGAQAAAWINEKLGGKGEIGMLTVQPGLYSTDQRQIGFEKALKKYPGIKLVTTQYDHDSTTQATTLTRSMLLAHPDIKAIFAVNTISATGAAQGLTAAGRAQTGSGDSNGVWLIGYDAEPSEVTALKSGSIQALIAQKPAMEGKLAVDYAYYQHKGQTSKVKKLVQLDNVLITKETMTENSKWFY